MVATHKNHEASYDEFFLNESTDILSRLQVFQNNDLKFKLCELEKLKSSVIFKHGVPLNIPYQVSFNMVYALLFQPLPPLTKSYYELLQDYFNSEGYNPSILDQIARAEEIIDGKLPELIGSVKAEMRSRQVLEEINTKIIPLLREAGYRPIFFRKKRQVLMGLAIILSSLCLAACSTSAVSFRVMTPQTVQEEVNANISHMPNGVTKLSQFKDKKYIQSSVLLSPNKNNPTTQADIDKAKSDAEVKARRFCGMPPKRKIVSEFKFKTSNTAMGTFVTVFAEVIQQ